MGTAWTAHVGCFGSETDWGGPKLRCFGPSWCERTWCCCHPFMLSQSFKYPGGDFHADKRAHWWKQESYFLSVDLFQAWGKISSPFLPAVLESHPDIENAWIIQMISCYAAGFDIQTWQQVQSVCWLILPLFNSGGGQEQHTPPDVSWNHCNRRSNITAVKQSAKELRFRYPSTFFTDTNGSQQPHQSEVKTMRTILSGD